MSGSIMYNVSMAPRGMNYIYNTHKIYYIKTNYVDYLNNNIIYT